MSYVFCLRSGRRCMTIARLPRPQTTRLGDDFKTVPSCKDDGRPFGCKGPHLPDDGRPFGCKRPHLPAGLKRRALNLLTFISWGCDRSSRPGPLLPSRASTFSSHTSRARYYQGFFFLTGLIKPSPSGSGKPDRFDWLSKKPN